MQKISLMDLLDRPTMIKMLEGRMEQLVEQGNADVQRLVKELERVPDDVELWFELGLAHNQAGLQYLDMAVEKAQLEYLETHGDAEEEAEMDMKVDVSEAKGLFEKALADFDKVLEMMPEYYGVQCQRGIALGNMQRYEEAEQCYLKALEEDEEDYAAAYYLGCTYRDMGDEEKSAKYLALAEELNSAGE